MKCLTNYIVCLQAVFCPLVVSHKFIRELRLVSIYHSENMYQNQHEN